MQRTAPHITPEEAAQASIPRVYRITSKALKNNKPLKFFAIGCQGNAAAQEKVAQLMNQIALEPDNRPDFILLLGDNFYDYGVASSHHPDFDAFFYQLYQQPSKAPSIAGIPCFVILGNHDENIHKKSFLEPEHGVKRGLHQVAHTYEANQYGSTLEKFWLYTSQQEGKETELNLDVLQPWNMPSRAYSLLSGQDQLFCIDSNTYIRDFFEYFILGDATSAANQARWLAEEMQKAIKARRNIMLAQHHPLISMGKRAYEADSKLYFNKQEFLQEPDQKLAQIMLELAEKLFPRIFTESGYPYHELLTEIFKRQQFSFNTVFSAHDHSIYYINNRNDSLTNYNICQITSGGGGGNLHKRKYFQGQNNMGCYLQEHGVVAVSCGKTNKFIIHTLEQQRHLEFSSDHCHALRLYPTALISETQKTEKFCALVKSAIDDYFANLSKPTKQTSGIFSMKHKHMHGAEGVLRANELWAYLCETIPDTYVATIHKVSQKMLEYRYTEPSQYSLITLLNQECMRHYGKDLAALHESVSLKNVPVVATMKIGF